MGIWVELWLAAAEVGRAMITVPLPLPLGCMGIQPKFLTNACAMGVDIRPGSWDVIIGDLWRPGPDRKVARAVFIGKVRDEVDVEFLAEQYPVRCGIVDSRPDGTLSKRLVDRLVKRGKNFWRAQYATNPSTVEMTKNEKERIITLERTMTLDNNSWMPFVTGMGAALPENFRDIMGGKFKNEMCASTRQPVMWNQEPWNRWSEGSDHAFHAWNYMMVAMQIGRMEHLGDPTTLMARPGRVESSLSSDFESKDDMDADMIEPLTFGGEETEDYSDF
jgi:hypothetical protein